MDARELRIGIWVNKPGEDFNEGGRFLDGTYDPIQLTAHEMFTGEFRPEIYKPIPLTKEWLVKLGFKLWCGSYERNDIKIFEVECGMFVLEGDGKSIGNIFNHVHQLQNLYFALTGEELTIK